MKKERIFYLDFVRAVATVIIILTHYNALFIYNTSAVRYDAMVLGAYFSDVYIGNVGVGLFLIISGAALMYQEENRTGVLTFYKKRLTSIYPMYWLAYILAFFYMFYTAKTIIWSAPKINIIYSILGIDMYVAAFGVPTFAIVGEWFIALIIMIYLIFPVLKTGVLKKPFLTALGVSVVCVISLTTTNLSIGLFEWLPAFVFGMFFVKYLNKVSSFVFLMSAIILGLNDVLDIAVNDNIKRIYVVLACFCIIVYFAQFVKKYECIKKISTVICKYSYPCFLIHHFIIYRVTESFNLNVISKNQSILLFVLCCILICMGCYVFQKLFDAIMNFIGMKS